MAFQLFYTFHTRNHIDGVNLLELWQLLMQPQSIQETDLFTHVYGRKIYIKHSGKHTS